MGDKLLIFRKAVDADSVTANSSGTNVDYLAIPASSLVNIAATRGKIRLSFSEGNDFSDSALSNSQSTTLSFCYVELTVTNGEEHQSVKALWNALSASKESVIVFDETIKQYPSLRVLAVSAIVRNASPTYAASSGGSLPSGGAIDQVLTKQSATDGDADWEYPHTLYVTVRNVSGGTLPKGTPVHANDVTGEVADVIAADASSASAMPCTYVLNEEIDNNAQGIAILTGTITGVDTSSFSPGDVVYVAAGGGFTNVKPTGTDLIQNLGVVTKSNASTGSGVVYGTGRSNDVPNLPTGKFFIGSASNTQESAYTLPTADGSANQILKTNGAGAVSFADETSVIKTAYIFHYADTGTSSKFFVADTLTELASEDYRTRTPMVEAGEITKAMIACASGANGSNYRLNIYLNGVATYSANATADTVAGDGRMQFTFSSATVSAGDVVSFRISGTASATASLPTSIGSAVLCVIKQDS